MQISPYLTFNGNCREAMLFYQECLGGHLFFQTLEDSPFHNQFPDVMKKTVLHATLRNDQMLLMGTDMVDESGLKVGNTVSLTLICSNEEEMKSMYKMLSRGGIRNQPVKRNPKGALSGDITDKFGNHWFLYCP